jgi:hypothetical protein
MEFIYDPLFSHGDPYPEVGLLRAGGEVAVLPVVRTGRRFIYFSTWCSIKVHPLSYPDPRAVDWAFLASPPHRGSQPSA